MDRVQVGGALSRAESSITELRQLERRVAVALASTKLSPDAWRSLRRIVGNPGCSMKDLSDSLALPPATATRIIDFLVARTAVYRRVADDDRRSVLVYPTDGGVHLSAVADAAVADAGFD